MKPLVNLRDENNLLRESINIAEIRWTERRARWLKKRDQWRSDNEKLKRLQGFVRQLNLAPDIEPAIEALWQWLKPLKVFPPPRVLLGRSQHPHRMYSFKGSQVRLRPIRMLRPISEDVKWYNACELRQLADEWGEPLQHSLHFSLPLVSSCSAVFFEYSCHAQGVEPHLPLLQSAVRALEITVDRLLLIDEVHTAARTWEQTFEGMIHPTAIVTKDFSLTRANAKFTALPYPAKCYEGLPKRTARCRGCPIDSNDQKNVSVIAMDTDHGEKNFEVLSAPIAWGSRQTVGYIHQYIDVTNQLELKSRSLQAEKMIALGHLAGHMAHELNNPLTGIQSMVEVLLSEPIADPQLIQDLNEVGKASKRCQEVIANFLKFADQGVSGLETVSVGQAIEKTLPFLKTLLRHHQVTVAGQTELLIAVNLPLFQQVFFNLIANAVQAMNESGAVHIEVSQDDCAEQVLIRIRDEGHGISLEPTSRVFEPFVTTKAKGKGTGIGLNLSRRLVRSFGGELTVEKTSPAGTTMLIMLPARNT